MLEELDQRAAARDVAAQDTDRLRQRADLNVDAPVHAEMIDGATAVPAEHAARVRVVHHHDAVELLGQVAQAGKRPRSPSMLKTPSVISSLRRDAAAPERPLRAASTSLCGKTLIVARLNRQPSTMLAWFSSSDTTTSSLVEQGRHRAGVGGETHSGRRPRLRFS